jgi:hypothetical protein
LSRGSAPLPIPIADQHAMAAQHAVISRRHHSDHLPHKELARMGRGPEHVDAP